MNYQAVIEKIFSQPGASVGIDGEMKIAVPETQLQALAALDYEAGVLDDRFESLVKQSRYLSERLSDLALGASNNHYAPRQSGIGSKAVQVEEIILEINLRAASLRSQVRLLGGQPAVARFEKLVNA